MTERDPVCGMTVDRGKALSLEQGGKTHYFCGPGCRTRFEQNPGGFTGGAQAPAAHAADH